MAHCSGATVRARSYLFKSVYATKLNSPVNYAKVLARHPRLRLCLAHFGGEKAWSAFMRDPAGTGEFKDEPTNNWLAIIRDMLPRYEHLYADISYTMFQSDANIAALKILLEDERICHKVLFGSDYYMSHMEVLSEREHCFRVRHGVGSTVFAKLAQDNVKAYLGRAAAGSALAREGLPEPPIPQVPRHWTYA